MAETTTNPAVVQQPAATPNYDEIFSKLDAILDKRADGLAKSALKDNGVEEKIISDIAKIFHILHKITPCTSWILLPQSGGEKLLGFCPCLHERNSKRFSPKIH